MINHNSKEVFAFYVSPAMWQYIRGNKNGREYEKKKEYRGFNFLIDVECAEEEEENSYKLGKDYKQFRVEVGYYLEKSCLQNC